ncbi:MAG TPA: HAD family hydrolase [Candidatus Polarisedimenticolaceae bacterium]|nr:HAD family hydrolase [Candidatus Polarisedimenticolaceae bacterium]
MTAKRLVLFDIDGTLIDTAGAGRRGLTASFRAVFGLDGVDEAAERVRFGGKSDPTIIADIAREAGLPPALVAERYADLQAAYLEALLSELARPDTARRVLPGVRSLLDGLAARGDVVLGLVTGNIEAGARAKLSAFDLNRYFQGGGFSSDHPDRGEIARIAHERLSRVAGFRFPAGDVVVVGDTELDVACARTNGFRAIAVESGWIPRAVLEAAEPHALFADLTDRDAVMAAMGLAG